MRSGPRRPCPHLERRGPFDAPQALTPPLPRADVRGRSTGRRRPCAPWSGRWSSAQQQGAGDRLLRLIHNQLATALRALGREDEAAPISWRPSVSGPWSRTRRRSSWTATSRSARSGHRPRRRRGTGRGVSALGADADAAGRAGATRESGAGPVLLESRSDAGPGRALCPRGRAPGEGGGDRSRVPPGAVLAGGGVLQHAAIRQGRSSPVPRAGGEPGRPGLRQMLAMA